MFSVCSHLGGGSVQPGGGGVRSVSRWGGGSGPAGRGDQVQLGGGSGPAGGGGVRSSRRGGSGHSADRGGSGPAGGEGG